MVSDIVAQVTGAFCRDRLRELSQYLCSRFVADSRFLIALQSNRQALEPRGYQVRHVDPAMVSYWSPKHDCIVTLCSAVYTWLILTINPQSTAINRGMLRSACHVNRHWQEVFSPTIPASSTRERI
ncbi:hypothetical protein ASPBRDRAFT_36583 [Aspergillus brasiliensis CBS 101740]|uniref:Uncharacterized protein n=1 Tax=Aspergillus brasiliensis (strain CBS 101740 / IMI 381727 / IBT 21946) TaxID=767769 RepID=A0A1L9V090_ASPBC|nr:hypothetical protein ASPBRDRAFT_36583 [Aspergillus brasiliensis CBS 101740]